MNIKNSLYYNYLDLKMRFLKLTCVLCDKILYDIKEYSFKLCFKCKNSLSYLRYHNLYDDEYFCFYYKNEMRKLILSYKFYKQIQLRIFFYYEFRKVLKRENIKYLVPVPCNAKNFKKRGYNQIIEILKLFDSNYKIIDLLYRTKDSIEQKGLNKEQRRKNIINKIKLKQNKTYLLKNKKIFLIDDVYTTGITIEECKRVLNEIGIKDIKVLCLSRTD